MYTGKNRGKRIDKAGPRGKLLFKYMPNPRESKGSQPKTVKHTHQDSMVLTEKREIKIEHQEWSRVDYVEDIYHLNNCSTTPVKVVYIKTEYFRDELEIYDARNFKLPFKPYKDKRTTGPDEINDEPYTFEIHLSTELYSGDRTVVKLKYKTVWNYPSVYSRIIGWVKDILPFYENKEYLYKFVDVSRTFTGNQVGSITFSAELADGTISTSYLIVGITKQFRGKIFDNDSNNKTDTTDTNELNYYSEGTNVFFALSPDRLGLEKIELEKIKYLLIFLKISPQRRIFYAISSIQLLIISLLISLGIIIHSEPFSDSFSLITGLLLSILTLFLIPEKSRLQDVRLSASSYSIILASMVISHILSVYLRIRIVGGIVDAILQVIPVIWLTAIAVLVYLSYLFYGILHNRYYTLKKKKRAYK